MTSELESDISNYPIFSKIWVGSMITSSLLLKFNFVSPSDLKWTQLDQVLNYQNYDYKKLFGAISQTNPVISSLQFEHYTKTIYAWRWVIFLYLAVNFSKKLELHVFRRNKMKYFIYLVYSISMIQLVQHFISPKIQPFVTNNLAFLAPYTPTQLSQFLINFNSLYQNPGFPVFADVLVMEILILFGMVYPRYNFAFGPVSFKSKYLPVVLFLMEYIVFGLQHTAVFAWFSTWIYANLLGRFLM